MRSVRSAVELEIKMFAITSLALYKIKIASPTIMMGGDGCLKPHVAWKLEQHEG